MPDEQEVEQDDPAQSQRFVDMAREVGAEENHDSFRKLFQAVAKPAPISEITTLAEKK